MINLRDNEVLWTKCTACGDLIFKQTLERNAFVCPKCSDYFQMPLRSRIKDLCGLEVKSRSSICVEAEIDGVPTLIIAVSADGSLDDKKIIPFVKNAIELRKPIITISSAIFSSRDEKRSVDLIFQFDRHKQRGLMQLNIITDGDLTDEIKTRFPIGDLILVERRSEVHRSSRASAFVDRFVKRQGLSQTATQILKWANQENL